MSKSSYTAFNEVDGTVAKPVLGSDGAARWQNFRQDNKAVVKSSVAPLLPLKRLDRALGTGSINDERANEIKIRSEAGDRELGAGYTEFKRKGDPEEAAARKRRKMILDRVRPDDVIYFIEAETFEGSKFDYVFTTRDRGTGYYWDGMDSLKKELGQTINDEGNINGGDAITDNPPGTEIKPEGKFKKKKKKPKDPGAIIPESDPFNPIEQVAAAINRRNQALLARSAPKSLLGSSTLASDAAALGANIGGLPASSVEQTTIEPELCAAGWESAKDPNSGKVYYFKRSTNERSWSKPILCKNINPGTSTAASDAAALGAFTGSSTGGEPLEPELSAEGWELAKDPNSSKVYYFRRTTNERSWTKPILSKKTSVENEDLLEGWKSAKDPGSGKVYYYDETGNTSWKRPEAKST